MARIIEVATLGVVPGSSDSTFALARLLGETDNLHTTTLVFSGGEYHFYPECAFEHWYTVLNNDSGCKRVAFPLVGAKNIAIEGDGATFLFHGRMIPFVIENSCNVTIRNCSIDWVDHHLLQGRVVGSTATTLDVTIDEGFEYEIADGTLYLCGYCWKSPLRGLLEVDSATGAPARGSGDHCGAPWHSRYGCTALGGRTVRIVNDYSRPATVGNKVILTHQERSDPGVFITGSRSVVLEKVVLYQAPAMGIIAQYSTDISLQGCSVIPRPQTTRLFSACADATHFVNCSGEVRIEDCHFACQMDDAANVHGVYGKLVSMCAPGEVLAGRMHCQQKGAPLVFKGDTIRFVDPLSLAPRTTAVVTDAIPVNADVVLVRFHPEHDGYSEGDLIENLTWNPSFVFRRNHVERNRARGILISTPGAIIIEDNHFEPGGPAIQSGGEGEFWFESGPVSDVVIRNNRFVDCNRGPWGEALLEFLPALAVPGEQTYYQRNVRVTGNEFHSPHPHLVAARSVDGLVLEGNRLVRSSTFKPLDSQQWLMRLEWCRAVKVARNSVDETFGQTPVEADASTRTTLTVAFGSGA